MENYCLINLVIKIIFKMSTRHIWCTHPPYSKDIHVPELMHMYILQVCLKYFMDGVLINKWDSIYIMYILYSLQLEIIIFFSHNKQNNYVGDEFSALQMTCSPWTSYDRYSIILLYMLCLNVHKVFCTTYGYEWEGLDRPGLWSYIHVYMYGWDSSKFYPIPWTSTEDFGVLHTEQFWFEKYKM